MAEVKQDVNWREMDFAALSQRRQDLLRAIQQNVEELVALDPALKTKGRELAMLVETDYSSLEASLRRLAQPAAPAAEPAPRQRQATPEPGRKRGAPAGRPERYALRFKDSKQPVAGPDGRPIRFKSKLQMLRGPWYEAALGDKISNLELVDTEQDKVVVDALKLGPAPGGRR